MAIAKVALSLPAPLLTQIDREAKKAGLSRSAFVRQAMERTLHQPADTALLRKAHLIYSEIGEDDRALAETFLSMAAETFPREHKKRTR